MHLAVYRATDARGDRPHPRRARHGRLHARRRTPARSTTWPARSAAPSGSRPTPRTAREELAEHVLRALDGPHRLPAAEPRHPHLRRHPRPGLRPHGPTGVDVPPVADRLVGPGPHARTADGGTGRRRRRSGCGGTGSGADRRGAAAGAGPARPVRPGVTPAGRTTGRAAGWPGHWTGAHCHSDGRGRHRSPGRRRRRRRRRPVRQRRRAEGAARPAPAHRTPAHRARHGRRPDHPHPRPGRPAPRHLRPRRATAPTRSSARSCATATALRRHRRAPPGTRHPRLPGRPATRSGSPRTCTSATPAAPSASTTPTSTSPANSAPCPPGSCPAPGDTWVITVHGLGATREHAHERHARSCTATASPCSPSPTAATSARPRSPDGLGHLGETEWRDLDAAMRYAVRYGARARRPATAGPPAPPWPCAPPPHSALRDRVCGLVLDSPVLDWRATRARPRRGPAHARAPCCRSPCAPPQGRTGLPDGDGTARPGRPRAGSPSRR